MRQALIILNLCAVIAIAAGVAQQPLPLDAGLFWRAAALHGSQAEHYETLTSMAQSADAVVVGRLRSIDNGRVFGEEEGNKYYYATVKIDVDELVLGSLDQDWSLEVPISRPEQSDTLRGWLSDGKALFFLRSKAREARMLGYAQGVIDQESGYYRLVTFEAVINDDNGLANPPLGGETAFSGVGSRPFADVVAELRAIES